MKRTLLSIIIAIIPLISNAQLNIVKYSGAEIRLGSLNASYDSDTYVMKKGNSFYICFSKLEPLAPGSNRRVQTFSRIFCLGLNKQSSIKTLQDLLQICETSNNMDRYDLRDAEGRFETIIVREHVIDSFGGGGALQPLDKDRIQKAINLIKQSK